jgi:hypothetical protein
MADETVRLLVLDYCRYFIRKSEHERQFAVGGDPRVEALPLPEEAAPEILVTAPCENAATMTLVSSQDDDGGVRSAPSHFQTPLDFKGFGRTVLSIVVAPMNNASWVSYFALLLLDKVRARCLGSRRPSGVNFVRERGSFNLCREARVAL